MTEQNTTLRIIYLEAENVKRLKAVRLRPDKTLVRIEGKNAQGKTSVLDAIGAAIGGRDHKIDEPVRKGERKARVMVDLGNGIVVERKWTAAGTESLVLTENGEPVKSPQAVLDKWRGELTLDPTEFDRMKPDDQAALLMKIAGVDFTALDKEYAEVFAERTIVNRNVKTLEARVGQMPPRASGTPVDLTELSKLQQEAVQHNAEVRELVRQAEAVDSQIEQVTTSANQMMARINADIERMQREFEKVKSDKEKRISEMRPRSEEIRKAIANQEIRDTTGFAAAIAEAQKVNDAIKVRAEYESRLSEFKGASKASDDLTERLKSIDDAKDKMMRAAKFPLPGLSIGIKGVLLNDVPFNQASSAERLRAGVAIALARNPRCKVILCRDGSLLDSASMDELHKIAEEFDAQCIVERVADQKSPSAVYIEDGEVIEQIGGAQ